MHFVKFTKAICDVYTWRKPYTIEQTIVVDRLNINKFSTIRESKMKTDIQTFNTFCIFVCKNYFYSVGANSLG